ncbi:MAG TPA: hypothetical protein VMT15_09680 [Bryobacteraceae bacterium]|nr:hypothetical protein [Bryobacteraceae bacterium]
MKMNLPNLTSRAVLALLVPLSFATAWAQPRMPISRTSTVMVKPDKIADFVAAVKDYNAVYSKVQGATARIQYQALTGATRYRLVQNYPDWAAMDVPPVTVSNADLARINARIQACFESITSLVTELLPDLSTAAVTEPPTLLRIARTRIRPDKVDEWMAIVKNELLPAYKKAGLTLTVRQVRFGAPTNEFYLSTRIANWADAGKNPLRDSMGADAYNKMVAKLTALTTLRELDIFRYRADMSWAPAR